MTALGISPDDVLARDAHFTVPSVDRSFSDDLAGPLHPRWVSPGLAVDDQICGPDASRTLIRAAARSSRAMTAEVARVTEAHWTFTADVDGVDGVAGVLLRLDDDALGGVRADSRLTRLLRGPAAVAGQHRTVDVRAVVGQQEGDRRRDLLGRGD